MRTETGARLGTVSEMEQEGGSGWHMSGSRGSGRHAVRLLLAISLGMTPLSPPPSRAVHLQVRAGKHESRRGHPSVPPLSCLHRGASFDVHLQTTRSALSGSQLLPQFIPSCD